MITWDKWVGTRIMVESVRVAAGFYGTNVNHRAIIDKIRQDYVFAFLNPEE